MDDYQDHISTNSRPDLGFDGIDALSVKRLDSQVLFDPFYKQFNLPAAFIILGDLLGITVHNVGQQDYVIMIFRINQPNTPQGMRVTLFGLGACQSDKLVALQTGRGINRCGRFSVKLQILLGSDHKTTTIGVQMIQALVIQVGTIHNIDAAGNDGNHIQDLHIVGPAVRNVNKCRYSPLQIHKGVNLNGHLMLAELSPWDQRQTQVNGRRIQRFYRPGELILAIKLLTMSDQYHGLILIDLPGPIGISKRQGAQGHIGFDAHIEDDIADKTVLRFSPHTTLRWYHRLQPVYAFFFYGLLTLYWVTLKDYVQFILYTRDGVNPNTRTQNVKLLLGIILTTVFQLAHSVGETAFPVPDDEGKIQNAWALHQMETTMNFAPKNRWLSWYLGGLNFQVEHHLFPGICHVHHPEVSEIVRETAREFDITYQEHESFAGALKSHVRYMIRIGKLPDLNDGIG